MSDTNLLLTGIAVFGLMIIGVVLTVMEFREMKTKSGSSQRERPHSPTSNVRVPDAGREGD